MAVSNKAKGYIRVSNYRKDMAPDSQPEDGETIIYVDRRNPVLGNPHILRNKLDWKERDRVIEAYGRDMDRDFAAKGPMSKAVQEIANQVLAGENVVLLCACKPLNCHADLIAKKVNELVGSAPDFVTAPMF